jgi:hypothetical protein
MNWSSNQYIQRSAIAPADTSVGQTLFDNIYEEGTMNLWRAPTPFAFRLLISVLLIFVAAFVLWTLYGTRYALTESTIIVQSGPFRWVIDLEAITEAFPTRNPLSSPACSLDRLQIRYGKSRLGMMISPQDKAGFLRDLVARFPGLKLNGDRVLKDKP